MKALVFSDSHGKLNNLLDVLEQHSDYEAIFHLGDVEGDEKRLRSITPYPVYMVRETATTIQDVRRGYPSTGMENILSCVMDIVISVMGEELIRFTILASRKRQMLSCLVTRMCRFWKNWTGEYILTPEVFQNRDKKIKFPLTP